MKFNFNIEYLMVNFPEAYNSLPESYKNDSCLEFFIDINDNICAEDDSMNQYMYAPGDGEPWKKIELTVVDN